MSKTSRHLPFDRLVDIAEGWLSAEEQTAARAHLAACPRCAGELAHLERLLGLMHADDSVDAPPQVIARAIRLFAPRAATRAPSPWERVLATLRFDSAQLVLAPGVRSATTAPRQLLFSAGAHELDLRIVPTGERWTVQGQVLGPDEGGQVTLHGAAGVVEGAVSEVGEFRLPPVPSGSYVLRLRLTGGDVEFPTLELGT